MRTQKLLKIEANQPEKSKKNLEKAKPKSREALEEATRNQEMGKGKVHPSPPPAGGETAETVLLRLLPAAVLAMAAPLGAEGKEVLAYLVLSSLRSSALPTPAREEAEGAGSGRKAHRPELGCGCFGCYTAYWSRWDGSPERDRETIHRAIEAFEEHLDRKEEGKGGRRRKKRAATAKDKAGMGKELAAVEPPSPPSTEQEETAPAAAVLAKVDEGGEEAKAEEKATTSAAAAGGVEEERRRRGWGAVAGLLNWRGWAPWGSH